MNLPSVPPKILHEFNFVLSKSSKPAVFHKFRGTSVSKVNFEPLKSTKIHQNQNSESQNVLKWQILHFENPQN